MADWSSLRVLCLGGAGQTGKEICRQLVRKGVDTIVVHDLERARAEEAIEVVRADTAGARTALVASAGNLFLPAGLGSWQLVDGAYRECEAPPRAERERLQYLLEARLGSFTQKSVRESLVWNLVHTHRPQVVVDTVNTATVLGYESDVIQSCRDIGDLSRSILDAAGDDLAEPDRKVAGDLAEVWRRALSMAAHLDTACMIRYVQCLHALFRGPLAVAEFERYVKVHTTGLGGMGFNIRYTHGDTGEPGLSTKLLGKVSATGQLQQLLLTLAHTPGCDVRMVAPATLVGFEDPSDAVIRDRTGPVPLVDAAGMVPCDGTTTLCQALEAAPARVKETGEPLEIPHLDSGENRPYAAEDVTAVSALGQMGCITKEEVGLAVLECIAGDSRYDVLTAVDSALLLPTHTAAVVRDRKLARCRASVRRGPFRLPSISIGNLGPTTAKHLYEIEILRATFETVERVVKEGTPVEMTLRACSFILEEGEGAHLRRQVLSLGIPVFLRKGPDRSGLLLGSRLSFPDPGSPEAARCRLDPDDDQFQSWLDRGWIDLTGPHMAWWHDRFVDVDGALRGERQISRNWFDPAAPFTAGQLLAYLYSMSGGQRKEYM